LTGSTSSLLDFEQRFTIACHTLAWENGADFAPEFLREHVQAAAA
jgi:hypothetical protein